MTCLLGTTLLGFTFYSYKGRCKLNQTRRFRAIQKPLPHQLGSLCLLSLKEYLPPQKKKNQQKNKQTNKQTNKKRMVKKKIETDLPTQNIFLNSKPI